MLSYLHVYKYYSMLHNMINLKKKVLIHISGTILCTGNAKLDCVESYLLFNKSIGCDRTSLSHVIWHVKLYKIITLHRV